jgi:hypothetical protein
MIFQYQYKRVGAHYSVDHYAGSNPEALDFCGTTVYPETAWTELQRYLEVINAALPRNASPFEFVDLDQEDPA